MKKTARLLCAATLALVCSTPVWAGGPQQGEFTLSPYLGGYTFNGNQDLDTALVYGLRLGYALTPAWTVEGVAETLTTEESGGGDVQFSRFGGDLLYHFRVGERFVPYLAGGMAIAVIDPDGRDDSSKGICNYGLGAKYYLSEAVALRGDVRHLIVTDSDHDSNLEYTLGLTFAFGGAQQAVAALDSDGDGVSDSLDRCPGTPGGTAVDGNGCPLPVAPKDSDGDGVTDDLDRCPDSPRGSQVNASGCPLDSDGDGVLDSADACPGTKSGVSVDTRGCPQPKEERVQVALDVKFATGKADIDPGYTADLKKVGEFMNTYPTTVTTIAGHTDNQGDAAMNKRLSQQRADNVRQYLIDNFAIAGERITAVGYGAEKPIADNATAAGRQQNRRIEAVIETTVKRAAE
jgi:OOP family OmpA-OmpF porin